MGVLVITHGLQGSGKSTAALEAVAADPINVVRANRDEIREALFGADYATSRPIPKNEGIVSEVQTKMIKDALVADKTVWVDDTNLNTRFLPALFALGEGHTVEQVYFDVPLAECLRRNRARADAGGRFVPEQVIEATARKAYDNFGHLKNFVMDSRGRVHAVPKKTVGSVKLDDFNATLVENYTANKGVVFVDVDGTLINNGHIARRAFGGQGRKNYSLFFSTVHTAPANPLVVDLANKMHDIDGLNIVVLTGRDDEFADELIEAVANSGIKACRVIAKKAGDGRPDYDFKSEVITDLIAEGFVPLHSIDDRARSVDMYESLGIAVSRVFEFTNENSELSDTPYATPSVETIYGTGACFACSNPVDTAGNICSTCLV